MTVLVSYVEPAAPLATSPSASLSVFQSVGCRDDSSPRKTGSCQMLRTLLCFYLSSFLIPDSTSKCGVL